MGLFLLRLNKNIFITAIQRLVMNKFESFSIKQENGQHHEINEVDRQHRLLENKINYQDSEKIDSLRREIASHNLNSAGQFNPTEVFTSSQEMFVSYLEKVSLRTLVSYIEKGGTKIKKIKELSLADKKALALLKKQEKSVLLVNPRLYFLSETEAGLLATKELLKRLEAERE